MSTFGDNTPREAVLEALRGFQYDYQLSLASFMTIVLSVLTYMVENWSNYSAGNDTP